MKTYTVSFDREFNRKGKGWRISHRENNSTFSSLVCELTSETAPLSAYVSNTRRLQQKLTDGTVPFSAITIVPLYSKSLMDIKDRNDNSETIAIYVEALAGEEIVSVQLSNCGSAFTRVLEDKSKLAFIAYAPDKNKWSATITQSNGQTITVNNTGKIANGKSNRPVNKVDKLRIKRVVYLPQTVYFTRPNKVNNTIATIKSAESISIAQALSKNSIVVGKPKYVIFDRDTLTDDDIAELREMLSKRRIFYKEITEEMHNNYVSRKNSEGKKKYETPEVVEVKDVKDFVSAGKPMDTIAVPTSK